LRAAIQMRAQRQRQGAAEGAVGIGQDIFVGGMMLSLTILGMGRSCSG